MPPSRGREVAAGLNRDRVRRERLLGIEHERQRLVVDLDEFCGCFRRMAVDRGNGGDAIAVVADGVVEHHAPVRAVAGRPLDIAVLVRKHGLNAGEIERGLHVDAADPRMRMRTSEYPCIQHAGQLNVR